MSAMALSTTCLAEVPTDREPVGRAVELDQLYGLVDDAFLVRGGALLVIGDPGIGKSTLLRAALDHAGAAGFLVLTTTGVESEAALPFAGLYELLRPALDRLDTLPDAQRDALSKAFGIAVGSTPEPFLVALATLNLLCELATSRPVLVGLDDVQWLDAPTQSALAFVARRVSGDPIGVIAAARRGFSGPFQTAGLEELDVAELSESAAREVLDTTGVGLSGPDLEGILRTARGNPLALVELPCAWRAGGVSVSASALPLTARLERAFAGRLSELPRETRDALLIAAVDSVDHLAEILAATSVLGSTAAKVDALEPAAAAGLVKVEDRDVQFRHPLIRSAVIQSETVARRQAAHAALADVLTGDSYRRTHGTAHMCSWRPTTPSRMSSKRTIAPRYSAVPWLPRSGPWSDPQSSPPTRTAESADSSSRPSTPSASAAATKSTNSSSPRHSSRSPNSIARVWNGCARSSRTACPATRVAYSNCAQSPSGRPTPVTTTSH